MVLVLSGAVPPEPRANKKALSSPIEDERARRALPRYHLTSPMGPEGRHRRACHPDGQRRAGPGARPAGALPIRGNAVTGVPVPIYWPRAHAAFTGSGAPGDLRRGVVLRGLSPGGRA